MRKVRNIVRIDESKCNGCGLCVPACAEGAIQIINGKARLVSEVYCDGLGACLGECPQGAITIEQRPAQPFDPEAVERRLQAVDARKHVEKVEPAASSTADAGPAGPAFGGCPGAAARTIARQTGSSASDGEGESAVIDSQLGNWPVQLHLVPVFAPYLQGAKLLISADCAPFALADFHTQLLAGRTVLIGCPKLDQIDPYREKLTEIFRRNDIESVEVVYMEVPCCYGLVQVVQTALSDSGKAIPLTLIKVGIRGRIVETAGPSAADG